MTPDKLREKGNRWRELGQYDLANIYNQHAVALEEIERLKGELEESRRDLQFVERWANHHGVKPHITAKEVLSMIQHYPPIRAITEGYEDGKIPDTPNPWDRAEKAERRAERLEADAERYRWMRDNQTGGVAGEVGIFVERDGWLLPKQLLRGAADAAIDAARSK